MQKHTLYLIMSVAVLGGILMTAGGCSDTSAPQATAVIETNHGTIELEFLPDKAPGHVNNFIKLAEKGFYDGCTFHRFILNRSFFVPCFNRTLPCKTKK